MIESEELAKKYLKENNWQPKKIIAHSLKSGLPDFSCSNNRHVEVKRIDSVGEIKCGANQIKKWYDLLNSNNRIFLMIFSIHTEYFYLFELTNTQKIVLSNKNINKIKQLKLGGIKQ